LNGVDLRVDEVFGFEVPASVPGVDTALLDPRTTWAEPAAYDAKARELAEMFRANFAKRFAAQVEPAVAAAGPRAT
jgi:phosphoenolpyruvate carboxykinase (ATP)